MMKVIPKNDAMKLYKKGRRIYIGVQTKSDDGKWWDMDEFVKEALCVPHANGSFEKLSIYFNKHFCPGCRLRYALDTSEWYNYFQNNIY